MRLGERILHGQLAGDKPAGYGIGRGDATQIVASLRNAQDLRQTVIQRRIIQAEDDAGQGYIGFGPGKAGCSKNPADRILHPAGFGAVRQHDIPDFQGQLSHLTVALTAICSALFCRHNSLLSVGNSPDYTILRGFFQYLVDRFGAR